MNPKIHTFFGWFFGANFWWVTETEASEAPARFQRRSCYAVVPRAPRCALLAPTLWWNNADRGVNLDLTTSLLLLLLFLLQVLHLPLQSFISFLLSVGSIGQNKQSYIPQIWAKHYLDALAAPSQNWGPLPAVPPRVQFLHCSDLGLQVEDVLMRLFHVRMSKLSISWLPRTSRVALQTLQFFF